MRCPSVVPEELLPVYDEPEVPHQEQELVRLVPAPPRGPGAVHVVHRPVLVGPSNNNIFIGGLALVEKLAEEKKDIKLKVWATFAEILAEKL